MKKLSFFIGLMFMAVVACGQNSFKYPLIVGTNGGTGGYLRLNGATSGSMTLQVPAVAGTTTFQFPTTLGTNGYVLTTNGAGVLSWGEAGGAGMTYPSGSGIPLVVGGVSWGTTITNNSANWNTAYSWGNHAAAGYASATNASFTGTFSMPTPFTLGGTSVTSNAAELNLLDGVPAIQDYSTENYGATGMGDIVLSTGPTISGATINYPAKATGTVAAATGITAAMLSRMIYFNTAAAIDITADPQIANGTSGQIITIIGSSDTNTLTLDDAAGLRLTGTMVLGIGDNITLFYEGTIGDWIEICRSAN